ncbi:MULTISPECIES: alcohol dehydrogenase catalytic domain-containing protein [Streptomyces]|jgi:D-arabinose 1-dehydrogenase-like Zn-dependent alcohol dehydrogenase|uniref:2-deoxy-scyllo-inosamine dehydrogenase n=2 Tax=unclassified Streptomyces TaxID=2593676 RepID=A0ABV2ZV18_9ACTN|nr:alcohol dehydrogenase catalytic domain-containing protein [Streptomyces sp. LUP47B]
MHAQHQPFTIDEVEVPEPGPTDVLVRVGACGIVPNLGNVLNFLPEWWPHLTFPPLPAVFGLDVAGEIVGKGNRVHGLEVGQRVYVNPGRQCGGCFACRTGDPQHCPAYTFNGYFGFGAGSAQIFADYPYGGMCEYMTAPQSSMVTIPDNLSFESAARFGYLGTAYRALRMAGADANSVVVVNGASGTLGVCIVLLAKAFGVRKILGVARNKEQLEKVRAIDPQRIEVLSTNDSAKVAQWIIDSTSGRGADIVVDALQSGSPAEPLLESFEGLARGGRHVPLGGVLGPLPINLNVLMSNDRRIIGSLWFDVADGQAMASMVESGTLDLSCLEHEVFDLEDVNSALALFENRNGGFSNYVITP